MTTPDLHVRVLARIEPAIKRAEDFLANVNEEWTTQEQIDLANDDLELYNALKCVVEMHEKYEYFDEFVCAHCRLLNGGHVTFPCTELKKIAETLGVSA